MIEINTKIISTVAAGIKRSGARFSSVPSGATVVGAGEDDFETPGLKERIKA